VYIGRRAADDASPGAAGDTMKVAHERTTVPASRASCDCLFKEVPDFRRMQ
jgi:hypothetical protein